MKKIEKKHEKIDIVICLDKGFVLPTGVLIYSICVNNPDVDIDFHLVIDDSLTGKDKKDLLETCSQFAEKKVILYDVDISLFPNFPLKNSDRLPRAAYYRLFLTDILPDTIDKVLYLDGDIIVRHSIIPLWQTNLNGYAVGVAIDSDEGTIEKYNRLRYPNQKSYFNSGVMLINLEYWRKNDVKRDFLDYLSKYSERIIHADQDILNVIFQDNKLSIPIKYNFQTGFFKKTPLWDYWKFEEEFKEGLKDPVIVHFAANHPWNAYSRDPHPYRSTFYKYQCRTKWNNIKIERRSWIEIIRNCVGDFLVKMKVLAPIPSNYIDVTPID